MEIKEIPQNEFNEQMLENLKMKIRNDLGKKYKKCDFFIKEIKNKTNTIIGFNIKMLRINDKECFYCEQAGESPCVCENPVYGDG